MIKIKDIIKDLELGKVYTDKDRPPFQAESINEDDLGLTYKKGKTVKVKHKTSGKSIVIVDKPAVRKEYEKIGYFAESVKEATSSKDFFSGNKVTTMDQKKAIAIAKKMGGNMTNAVKKIEKIKKGLSKDKQVAAALKKANESINEGIFSSWLVKKAIELADKMGGNMTGAVKKIEKLKRGLSKDKQVVKALRLANESVNEAGTKSIDGEELLNYLQKRFKMSRKQAIASMKKHNMDVSSIKKESVNEAIEPQGIMAKINKIVQDKQAMKISGVLVDMFSASIMMQIYNAVNDTNKEQMNKGTMRQVQVILHKVMKQNKVTK